MKDLIIFDFMEVFNKQARPFIINSSQFILWTFIINFLSSLFFLGKILDFYHEKQK